MSRKLARRANLTEQEALALVEGVIDELTAKKNSAKCSLITECLTSLGYDITEGKAQNHKIVSHKGLPNFTTGSYDCGHGKNDAVKLPYTVGVIKFIKAHKDELVDFLKDQK